MGMHRRTAATNLPLNHSVSMKIHTYFGLAGRSCASHRQLSNAGLHALGARYLRPTPECGATSAQARQLEAGILPSLRGAGGSDPHVKACAHEVSASRRRRGRSRRGRGGRGWVQLKGRPGRGQHGWLKGSTHSAAALRGRRDPVRVAAAPSARHHLA